jgi:predicted metal-binding protein
MSSPDTVIQAVLAVPGVYQAAELKLTPDDFHEETRDWCRQDTCGYYGRCWSCPPAVGSVEQCRQRCVSYKKALLFSARFPGLLDEAGAAEARRRFMAICDAVRTAVSSVAGRVMILSAGGCVRCEKCAYPQPCRFPDKILISLEAMGLFVGSLTARAGMARTSDAFYGAVLYDCKP